jgi:mannose-1-phosphate guanylyltransferase
MGVKNLKAVILIGGFGTRLRPLSCTRPKALFPIIERLLENGVDEVVLAVNKLTRFHIRQQRLLKRGLTVKYSIDPPKMPLGTAGPIKKAEILLGHDEPFLVLNGDLITEINYCDLFKSHIEDKAVATIALHEVVDPSRYGVAELAGNNRIRRFIEKPPRGTESTNLINAGVYVLSPKIFDYIPKGRPVSLEREVFPKLAKENLLYGHKVDGLWIDIGRPEEYLQTNMKLLRNCEMQKHKSINFSCVNPVLFGKNTSVGQNSIVGPCVVLGRNVLIGKNVHIRDSVVFQDAIIDDNAEVSGALVGESAKIGKGAKISQGCIVADHAKVKDGVSLPEKVHVCPAKEIT